MKKSKNMEISYEAKVEGLKRILSKDFDECRMTIYDCLSDVIDDDDKLEWVNRDIKQINQIRKVWDELDDAHDEESYKKIDLSYFKRIPFEFLVDVLVDDLSVDADVAKAILKDVHGKLNADVENF